MKTLMTRLSRNKVERDVMRTMPLYEELMEGFVGHTIRHRGSTSVIVLPLANVTC